MTKNSDMWLLDNLSLFDAIVDLRDEVDFAAGAIPGSLNLNLVLSADEQETVNTVSRTNLVKGNLLAVEYTVRRAHQLVASLPNVPVGAQFLLLGDDAHDAGVEAVRQALCARHAKVAIVQDGFAAVEAWVENTTRDLSKKLRFHVISGSVASGKTDLLHALAAEGEQVIDTDSMLKASARGVSAFAIQCQLAYALKGMATNKSVWVEYTGSSRLDPLLPAMLAKALKNPSQLYLLSAPLAERVRTWACKHVTHLSNPQQLIQSIAGTNSQLSEEVVSGWQNLAASGETEATTELIQSLISVHWDVRHRQGLKGCHSDDIVPLSMPRLDEACFKRAARALATA